MKMPLLVVNFLNKHPLNKRDVNYLYLHSRKLIHRKSLKIALAKFDTREMLFFYSKTKYFLIDMRSFAKISPREILKKLHSRKLIHAKINPREI